MKMKIQDKSRKTRVIGSESLKIREWQNIVLGAGDVKRAVIPDSQEIYNLIGERKKKAKLKQWYQVQIWSLCKTLL